MTPGYEIELQKPVNARRGDHKLILVLFDPQGAEVFRDWADLNAASGRRKVSEEIASMTGDAASTIETDLLDRLGQVQPPPKPSPETIVIDQPDYPYAATPKGLVWYKEAYDQITPVPLCTFNATIVGEVLEDDGVESKRLLEIEAVLHGKTHRFSVPISEFSSMNWPIEQMGSRAVIFPGFSTKDRVRAAIQLLSEDPHQRKIYSHVGWREIEGSWCYLHADGAIGPDGPVDGIEVSLPSDLSLYRLPTPSAGDDLIRSVQASLRFLDVAGDLVTVPIFSSIYRAPLGSSDAAIHLVGGTGAGKTAVAALAQQHYGAEMDALKLPGSWLSTDNSLEALAFTAKDALFLVDDFCPVGGKFDVQGMHKKADRLFRAQGNNSGRGRLRSDGTLRPTKPPRCMVLSTGEDTPKGQSLRARMLVVDLPKTGPGSADFEKLTACQADAAAGYYTAAMAGYLRWLASRCDDIRDGLRSKITHFRDMTYQSGQHRRTPNIVANLAVGIAYFLDFALEVGAIDQQRKEALWLRCWSALGKAADAQQEHQSESEPVETFGKLLASVLSSGLAHLAGPDGSTPQEARSWGWREREVGNDSMAMSKLHPQGQRIGWIDDGKIYIDSTAAFSMAQRLAESSGNHLVVSLPTLKRRMNEQGMLASTEHRGGKERLDVRRQLEGQRRSVLHVRKDLVFPGDAGSASSDFDEDSLGHFSGPLNPGPQEEVAQLSQSKQGEFVPGDPVVRPLGPLGPLSQSTTAQSVLINERDEVVEGQID